MVRLREKADPETVGSEFQIDQGKMFAITKALHQSHATTSETPTLFLYDGAAQTGPFTLTQVQAKLLNGEISRDAQYWSEGMTEWQNVLELSSQPLE
jgi:hypothetical protein